MDFYLSVFRNSRKLSEFRNPGKGAGPVGAILTIVFELDGVRFTALNGVPNHKFNEAVSFVVRCDSQDEVDYYWSRLIDGGSEIACGWSMGFAGKLCRYRDLSSPVIRRRCERR